MTPELLLLIILAILVYSGLLQRVLDRMYLTDRQALILIAAMIVGTWIPDIILGQVSVNIGGAVIPIAICAWVLYKTDTSRERLRTILGSLVTGVCIYLLSRFFPAEAEMWLVDPMWLYGIIAGAIAWVISRSRRAAFISGVLGTTLADVAAAFTVWLQGYDQPLRLGGAGIADAIVVAGVTGVLFCELAGEVAERLVRSMSGRNGA